MKQETSVRDLGCFLFVKKFPHPWTAVHVGVGNMVGRLFDPGLDQGVGVRLGPRLEDPEPLDDLAVIVELVPLG